MDLTKKPPHSCSKAVVDSSQFERQNCQILTSQYIRKEILKRACTQNLNKIQNSNVNHGPIKTVQRNTWKTGGKSYKSIVFYYYYYYLVRPVAPTPFFPTFHI